MSTNLNDHLYPRGRSVTEPDLLPSVKDSDGNDVLFNSSKRKTTQSTVVDLGTSPNANDGDPLRTAFGKINNFIEAEYWVNEAINQKLRDFDSELREGVFLYTDSEERYNISLLDDTKFYLRGNRNQIEVNVTNPNDSEVSVNFNLTELVDVRKLRIFDEDFEIYDRDSELRVSFTKRAFDKTFDERDSDDTDMEFNVRANVILGRDSDDTLVVNSRIASNLIPYGDEIYNLGDSDNKWRDLWLSGSTIHLGSIQIKNLNNRGLVLIDSDGKTLNLSINEGRAATLTVDSDFLAIGSMTVSGLATFDSDVFVKGVSITNKFADIDSDNSTGLIGLQVQVTNNDSDILVEFHNRTSADSDLQIQITNNDSDILYLQRFIDGGSF